jgi:hypothetical protein
LAVSKQGRCLRARAALFSQLFWPRRRRALLASAGARWWRGQHGGAARVLLVRGQRLRLPYIGMSTLRLPYTRGSAGPCPARRTLRRVPALRAGAARRRGGVGAPERDVPRARGRDLEPASIPPPTCRPSACAVGVGKPASPGFKPGYVPRRRGQCAPAHGARARPHRRVAVRGGRAQEQSAASGVQI